MRQVWHPRESVAPGWAQASETVGAAWSRAKKAMALKKGRTEVRMRGGGVWAWTSGERPRTGLTANTTRRCRRIRSQPHVLGSSGWSFGCQFKIGGRLSPHLSRRWEAATVEGWEAATVEGHSARHRRVCVHPRYGNSGVQRSRPARGSGRVSPIPLARQAPLHSLTRPLGRPEIGGTPPARWRLRCTSGDRAARDRSARIWRDC